jgi:protein TonB
MSESSLPAQQHSLAGTPAFGAGHPEYKLSDDLARLCLPQEYKDSYRRLAWVNSICFLVLLIGLVGMKGQRVIVKPLSEPQEIVPVVFTPPEEPPPTQPEVKPEETPEPQNTPEETPQVVTVVAAADPTAVAFAVPVQGAVAVTAAAHLASPPPPMNQAPPRPVQFNPTTASDGGSYPPPMYPSLALRNHYEGTAIIEIKVATSGAITSATVYRSSGFPVLDEAALDVVKKRWHFGPAGKERWLQWPCMFKMQ